MLDNLTEVALRIFCARAGQVGYGGQTDMHNCFRLAQMFLDVRGQSIGVTDLRPADAHGSAGSGGSSSAASSAVAGVTPVGSSGGSK